MAMSSSRRVSETIPAQLFMISDPTDVLTIRNIPAPKRHFLLF